MSEKKELIQVTEHVYCYPHEEERDRPILGYVRGKKMSLAVDAGHSDAHVDEFYAALDRAGLPRPSITVITHWHWDHTFGMHHIDGLSVANPRTNALLKKFIAKMTPDYIRDFKAGEPSIALEYQNDRPMIVCPSDIEYEGSLTIDLGGISVSVFDAPSPHTDDSSLICVPSEKVLFLGDSVCGEYPTWKVDPEKAHALISVIEGLAPDWCLTGHWQAQTTEEVIQEMLASIEE